jgi:hypothetical protein
MLLNICRGHALVDVLYTFVVIAIIAQGHAQGHNKHNSTHHSEHNHLSPDITKLIIVNKSESSQK